MSFCYTGDTRDGMRQFIAQGIRAQTVVTSPPYWGLRDYGVAGQIGLEDTPAAYVERMVEVFRLVRDLLSDDGTLWLNLGDGYATGTSAPRNASTTAGDDVPAGWANRCQSVRAGTPTGLKTKDLIGIPWRVAFALQQPYYAGRIRNEVDRAWLAAMVDGEGCFYIHKRLAGQHAGDGYTRQSDTYSPAFEVANTHKAIVDRCMALAGVGSVSRQDKDRRQPLYRWTVRSDEAKAIAREIYPYLVGKQQQCRIVCGMPSNGERAEAAWAAMKLLHAGSPTDVDFGAPASPHMPGWYLRSDIIWSKPNPMPESVTDRPTKAHEYLFLLSKSERYYYDAPAIKEPASSGTHERRSVKMPDGWATHAGAHGSFHKEGREKGATRKLAEAGSGTKNNTSFDEAMAVMPDDRNKRTVWTIATEAFPEAHFATFPQALVEPCILAGSRVGDIVFDPFMGSGTVGQVAQSLGRKWIGCELNPQYVALQAKRTAQLGMELA